MSLIACLKSLRIFVNLLILQQIAHLSFQTALWDYRSTGDNWWLPQSAKFRQNNVVINNRG